METANEVWFDNLWWAHREGNRIWVGKSYERRADLSEAKLLLVLTEAGGLALDPEWQKGRLAEIAHARLWLTTLRRLTPPVSLELKLIEPPPLYLFSEQAGMLEYLRKVARGASQSPPLVEEERQFLTQALEANFPEVSIVNRGGA